MSCCQDDARCQGGEVVGPTEWAVTAAAAAAVMNRIPASNAMQEEGRDTAKDQRSMDRYERKCERAARAHKVELKDTKE
jgi:hypothetical protein